jgi:hypothetical protein
MEKPVEPGQALFPRHTEPEDQCKEGEISGSIYLNHSATTGEASELIRLLQYFGHLEEADVESYCVERFSGRMALCFVSNVQLRRLRIKNHPKFLVFAMRYFLGQRGGSALRP